MSKLTDQNKLIKLAIQQNLLLWQLSKSFLDIEKKISKSVLKPIL